LSQILGRVSALPFLLPFYDICNIGEPVIFSEAVEKGSAFERILH
jgi:hypothetical protein